MKIAVVSDTHWQPERPLPRVLQLLEAEKPDMILHAGDWTNLQLWGYLSRIAQTFGVAGNCDGAAIVAEMGLLRLLDVEDVKIGLMHGQLFGATAEQAARRAFTQSPVRAVVFGHSHIPCNREEDGVLYFNPGSAVRPMGEVKRPSYGILTVNGADIKGEIVYFDK